MIPSAPVRALVGPARSGTTWVGSIINSSPDVIYRFEPFHRMSTVDPEFRAWFDNLKAQQVTADDIPHLYHKLIRAHPLTDKAPFFSNKSYPLRTLGREKLWPLARILSPAGRLYGAVYSPRPGPPVVFKEVTFIKPIRNLLERTTVPLVYLVRHPCATVLSEVRRQSESRMSIRVHRLRELLMELRPWLIEQFPEIVSGSDVVSRTALLWRCEIEACVSLVRQSANALVMTYEQFADDAHACTRRLFSHLGIAFTEQTTRFLDSLYALDAYGARGPQRTGWGRKYFSVYRNPREEKDSWKRRISDEDRQKVESIVQGSQEIEYCGALGHWW